MSRKRDANEHYPRGVAYVDAFCKKCQAYTSHKVNGGKRGQCFECWLTAEIASIKAQRERGQLKTLRQILGGNQ